MAGWSRRSKTQDLVFLILLLVLIKRIGRYGESKIPLRNSTVEIFSLDLLQAVMIYWAESYLEHCRPSTMDHLGKYSQRS